MQRIEIAPHSSVSALLIQPAQARACYVFAQWRGRRHGPCVDGDDCDGARPTAGIATLRYQFSYMEKGSKRPDPPAGSARRGAARVKEAARCCPKTAADRRRQVVRQAADVAGQAIDALPAFAGLRLPWLPLHPAGKPSSDRAKHLVIFKSRCLFLQGRATRWQNSACSKPVRSRLGTLATLHLVKEADHSFHVLARSGRNDREVMSEVLDAFAAWSVRSGPDSGGHSPQADGGRAVDLVTQPSIAPTASRPGWSLALHVFATCGCDK